MDGFQKVPRGLALIFVFSSLVYSLHVQAQNVPQDADWSECNIAFSNANDGILDNRRIAG